MQDLAGEVRETMITGKENIGRSNFHWNALPSALARLSQISQYPRGPRKPESTKYRLVREVQHLRVSLLSRTFLTGTKRWPINLTKMNDERLERVRRPWKHQE